MNAHASSKPSSSASGAMFRVGADYFHKFSAGTEADHIKRQTLWLASLGPEQAHRFPGLCFGYWNPAYALQSQQLLDATAAADLVLIAPDARGSVLGLWGEMIDWLTGTLHEPHVPAAEDTLRATFAQTKQRLDQCRISPEVRQWLHQAELKISSRSVRGLGSTLAMLERIVSGGAYSLAEQGRLHGDVHLGNLMVKGARWWLIDPRGVFPNGAIDFDLYYEWGKLLHEVHAGYSLICAGKLDCRFDGQEAILLSTACDLTAFYGALLRSTLTALDRSYAQRGCYGVDRKRALLFEGLILLGIVPFHDRYPSRVLTFVCIALLLLDDFLHAHESDAPLDTYSWEIPFLELPHAAAG